MSVSHFSRRVFELVLSDVCLFLSNVWQIFGSFCCPEGTPVTSRQGNLNFGRNIELDTFRKPRFWSQVGAQNFTFMLKKPS